MHCARWCERPRPTTGPFPRGGGVSYTAGYTSPDPGAVLIDTGGLDRVLDVSTDDGYVTVEAGCTWAALAEALEPTGCRPAFFGPFSGAFATVGGAISQSAVVWGAGRCGASAEAVLSMGVVVADGTLLRTGHDATRRPDGTAPPHFRPYGPDLTGLFLGDCGALGVKATVTLRLVDVPPELVPLTFTFRRDDDLVAAMGELARRELGSTVVATDAAMARQRIRRAALEQGRLPEDGDIGHTLHAVVDGTTAEGVEAEADLVTTICIGHGGADAGPGPTRELVELRYLTMTSSVGPDGERWAPLHAIAARSDSGRALAGAAPLETTHADALAHHRVTVAYLLTTVSTQAIIIEPALYWPGPRRPFTIWCWNRRSERRWPSTSPIPRRTGSSPPTGARCSTCSSGWARRTSRSGAPIRTRRRATRPRWPCCGRPKRHLDPEGLINPGVLGLRRDARVALRDHSTVPRLTFGRQPVRHLRVRGRPGGSR